MNRKLSEIKVGTQVEVISYEGEVAYEFKFISLGILPGDRILVKSKSLFGGPISIKQGDYNFFALRKKYADKIIVKEIKV
jgi:Fe2+ transport system protein FeoA